MAGVESGDDATSDQVFIEWSMRLSMKPFLHIEHDRDDRGLAGLKRGDVQRRRYIGELGLREGNRTA